MIRRGQSTITSTITIGLRDIIWDSIITIPGGLRSIGAPVGITILSSVIRGTMVHTTTPGTPHGIILITIIPIGTRAATIITADIIPGITPCISRLM